MSTHAHHPMSFRAVILPAILTGALLLSGACASVSPAEKKLLAQKTYDEAKNPGSTKQEKYQKIKKAIRIAPKEPLYWVGLGDEYFKDQKLDMAEKAYLNALKADPEYRITYRMLGRLYMQKGQWSDATRYLRQALKQPNVINPVQLYNWLAYSEYRKGNLSEAEKAWLKALDIRDNDRIRLNLALVYKEGNRFDLAKASLLKALEINPKLPSAHFALGEIYYKRNKYRKARKHFNEVIQLEPLGEQAKLSQAMLKKLTIK